MTIWWILGLWVGASILIAPGMGIGSALGYRRGWERHRALAEGLDPRSPHRVPEELSSGNR